MGSCALLMSLLNIHSSNTALWHVFSWRGASHCFSLARTARLPFPGLRASDSTLGETNRFATGVLSWLSLSNLSDTMERPLEDTTIAMLWKTLFATIVELSLRSGLFTAEELTPPLVAPAGNGMVQPQELSHEGALCGGMEEGTDAYIGAW